MYIDRENLNCNVNPEKGHFLADVSIGKGKDRKRIKARGATEDEAARKLEQKLIDLGFIAPPVNTPKLVMSVNQFTSIPDFCKEYRVNGVMQRIGIGKGKITSRTAENYVNMLKPFEEYFQFATVSNITTNVLNQFFYELVNEKDNKGDYKYSQVTLKRIEFVVHSMFRRAVNRKWIIINPFSGNEYESPISKKKSKKIEGLTPEELREFLSLIKSYPIIYCPITLMLNTGMRTQEVIGLQWGDLDFERDRLFVRRAVTMEVEFDEDGKIKSRKSVIGDTKTEGSAREIGLTPEAKEILLMWRETAPKISKTKFGDEDFVFGYERKPNYTYCSFRDRVNDYLTRQAGSIDKMRLHRFRHTVATLLVAESRELLQIMKQLGITQEKTLLRYVDQQGNQKIIAGNVDAISKGLSDMVSRADKKVTDDGETMKVILKMAENLTDGTAKTLIMALAGVVQRS